MKPFSVSSLAVCRFLLDVQGLLSDITGEAATVDQVSEMIQQLECVQLDPVAVVERNQHLVLAARMGGYRPTLYHDSLRQGHVFEYLANAACAIPIKDYPLFQPIRERIAQQLTPQLESIKPVVKQVLERLEAEGPLPARAFQSSRKVHGYWDNQFPKTKATSHALNLLLDAGVIRVVGREGNERFFDLTRRTIPEKVRQQAESIDMDQARELLVEKYLRAYRVFDPADPRFGWQKMKAAQRREALWERMQKKRVVPLQIEGVHRTYFILASDLDRLQRHETAARDLPAWLEGPIRFLPPLDNLLWRRERVEDLFGFSYKWEIYTPREKRRFGAYVMPILAGDRLIGRIDPRLNREGGSLTIQLLQLEPDIHPTPRLREHLQEALYTFAHFHGVDTVTIEKKEGGNGW